MSVNPPRINRNRSAFVIFGPLPSGSITYRHSMQFLRLLLVASVTAAWASAQEPLYTLKVSVPLVTVDVTVSDSNHLPQTSLKAEDFRVYEDGVEQQIRNFTSVGNPYNILLLFDRSGSTQDQWPLMQRAVARFLGNLRPQDRAAIAAFDEKLEVLAEWRASRENFLKAFDELVLPKQAGNTNFYRALERATEREF